MNESVVDLGAAGFHPAVSAWFSAAVGRPTPCQEQAWPLVQAGRPLLVAAPTGSGKTLAAFLGAIDGLVRDGVDGRLEDETRVLYVSPLRALSNDIDRNLQQPLAGIQDRLWTSGVPAPEIRSAVRTGDTTAADRERMRRRPPHILVTTPESLFILLTSDSGRSMLSTVRTVIVDEIHALAGNKRGAHLALSLERLEGLTASPPLRIGLSATQRPVERIAAFLAGSGRPLPAIVDLGHDRERDLAIELPRSPLEAVMSGECWVEIYDRLQTLIESHRTTLIFVNTRRMTERLARQLAERLGEERVAAHHGSLSRETRLSAEQRLKSGRLSVLVATASLELGIDIGAVDLVCQIGSPRSISAFLQRAGRSRHQVGGVPRARLFPLSRDELVECVALLGAVRRGELDETAVPDHPLDVLAQQIVAEVAGGERGVDELFRICGGAWPYRSLGRDTFDAVVAMLATGFSTRRGRRSAYLHHDAVNGRLRPRKGARLTALTNAGAIPDLFDYDVVLEPDSIKVGTLNEDFAFESLPGDIFQLGNTSYRILRVERGTVRVTDAHGQPPNIPFWFGEAPGRSDALSAAVSGLRGEIEALAGQESAAVADRIAGCYGIDGSCAQQLCDYLLAARSALGVLPGAGRIVLERFFDESGDMHLVVHSTYGSRINRAWGLALRKRFCRRFNFELQAAALEDSIVLSLGATHSFALDEVARYLDAGGVRELLIQALLDAPMFPTHWRWVATTALAVRRSRGGSRVPAPLQRADAEDLIAVVFPDQLACVENLAGEREVPDHPLVQQTVRDCIHGVMDVEGLERVLAGIASGAIQCLGRDLTTPSPLAQEVITARPYAFLDDAPAEERRTLAVRSRGLAGPGAGDDWGRLDGAAIEQVREQAWPAPANADELHDALVLSGFVNEREFQAHGWSRLALALDELFHDRRAAWLGPVGGASQARLRLLVAAERLAEVRALTGDAALEPLIEPAPPARGAAPEAGDALVELVRSRLECLGPVVASRLAEGLGASDAALATALARLENEGFALQGRYSDPSGPVEWCERRLLARIHRYTLGRLRREIEPVSAAVYMRFLVRWQHAHGSDRGYGMDALTATVEQLAGLPLPVTAWEGEVLPIRVADYVPSMLDQLGMSGWVRWLVPPRAAGEGSPDRPIRTTPVLLLPRATMADWAPLLPQPGDVARERGSVDRAVLAELGRRGALFFDELLKTCGQLPAVLEESLQRLVAAGLVTSDHFNGLRSLLLPAARRPAAGRAIQRRPRRHSTWSVEHGGRWVLTDPHAATAAGDGGNRAEAVAWTLLHRYGVVFRALLRREADWLPPWRDLVAVLRRLEARGDVRGGRFVDGFSGEQFALPDAVGALRRERREDDQRLLAFNGGDPLNLTGILDDGPRVPASSANRVLYQGGICVAAFIGGRLEIRRAGVDARLEWQFRTALNGTPAGAARRPPVRWQNRTLPPLN